MLRKDWMCLGSISFHLSCTHSKSISLSVDSYMYLSVSLACKYWVKMCNLSLSLLFQVLECKTWFLNFWDLLALEYNSMKQIYKLYMVLSNLQSVGPFCLNCIERYRYVFQFGGESSNDYWAALSLNLLTCGVWTTVLLKVYVLFRWGRIFWCGCHWKTKGEKRDHSKSKKIYCHFCL